MGAKPNNQQEIEENEEKNTTGLVLSVLLAVVVAEALNFLAVSVDPSNNILWTLLSVIFLVGVIGLILLLIEIKHLTFRLFLKSALIMFFSLFIFGISRYLNLKRIGINAAFVKEILSHALIFLALMGAVFLIWGAYIRYKKEDVSLQIICFIFGIIIILLSLLLAFGGFFS